MKEITEASASVGLLLATALIIIFVWYFSEREASSDELGLKDVFHQTSEVHHNPPELTIQLQTSENLYLSCLLLSSVNEKIVSRSLQRGKEFRHDFHNMQLYFGHL